MYEENLFSEILIKDERPSICIGELLRMILFEMSLVKKTRVYWHEKYSSFAMQLQSTNRRIRTCTYLSQLGSCS